MRSISVPGAYAALEARTALRRGLHVFLFSDNVPLAEEVELKRLAASRQLLCMGPDCGTAYLGGVGLGFANVVPRGRVGCVAASGTGLQAVVTRLAALGEGVSHGIGVGGRDLSAEVGGTMTQLALATLARDARTEVIVVISKPPSPAVLPALEAAIRSAGKPVVVCCLGAVATSGAPGTWVGTLDDAADAVVALLRHSPWTPRASAIRPPCARGSPRWDRRTEVCSGSTRAARSLTRRACCWSRCSDPSEATSAVATQAVLPATRSSTSAPTSSRWVARIRCSTPTRAPCECARPGATATSASCSSTWSSAVVRTPIRPSPWLARCRRRVRLRSAAGRSLLAVASVVGTEADPQGLHAQVDQLRAAGVEVLPSNAQAARFAAVALRPDLVPTLLGAR